VVIAILGEILSPSSGLLNRFLVRAFNMEPIYFVNLPQWFRPIYVLTDSWQFTGWTAIIYLAAITNINSDLCEAAEIDGASRLKKIWYVTIPSIMPTIMVMLILQIGRMLALGFEKVLLLYTPANSQVSDILDTLVYRTGLAGGTPNYSYATAIGLFSSIIGLILVSSANFISRKTTGESIYKQPVVLVDFLLRRLWRPLCKKSRLMGMLSEFAWYIFAINCKNFHKTRKAQQTPRQGAEVYGEIFRRPIRAKEDHPF
jgi:putative aldouronate transport system permease protein